MSEERRDLALICGDQGRYANARNLLSQCRRFHLDPEEATAIMTAMEQAVRARWHDCARASGVSERDCGRISRAFAYPGFRIGWDTNA